MSIHAVNKRGSMKNIENIEDICGFDALYKSMKLCKSGVMWKDSTAHYVLNGLTETLKLERQLHDGTYKERPGKEFKVYEPKERDILSISFRDRVYQRSLCDNRIYPAVTKSFIYDNCACQKGKGTDFAMNRLNAHLQRFYRKYGTDGWVLQCDIKGYYPNMPHSAAKDKFRRCLDDWSYCEAEKIFDGFEGDRGFNPGSQIVQIAGIAVLDDLDHMIKEKLRVKYYLRYMDDFILIGRDKEQMVEHLGIIKEYLKTLGFELNEKTSLYKLSKGIKFLGFKFLLTDTGKVIRLIKSENVKKERKKLRKLVNLSKQGRLTRDKVDTCYQSWKAHVSRGNTWRLLKRMDEFYAGLWKGDNHAVYKKECEGSIQN